MVFLEAWRKRSRGASNKMYTLQTCLWHWNSLTRDVMTRVSKCWHHCGPDWVPFWEIYEFRHQWMGQATWETVSSPGIGLSHPSWQRRNAASPVSLIILPGSRRAFSAVAPALWNILLLGVRLAPTLLTFQKILKTWLCLLAWGFSGGESQWMWLID